MTGQGPAVDVVDLVKRYPKSESNAVDGLSFTVGRGEVFGLLGPNGAGKSTTVGILTTRLRATGGQVRVGGIDVRRDPVAARARLAVMPQHSNLDRSLTPRQNLTFHAAYHGVGRGERAARAAELLQRFGLDKQADARLDRYSGGMAQRLMLARSLMHDPAVLFLDEPTNALDPQTRLLIRGEIRGMRERGVTVVLTTHQLNEAVELADRVAIVDRGRIIALDTPSALIRALAGQTILDLSVACGQSETDTLIAALQGVDGVQRGERLASPSGDAPPAAANGGSPTGAGPPAGGPLAAMGQRLAAAGVSLADRQALRAEFLSAGPAGRAALRERVRARLSGPSGLVKLRLYLSCEPVAVLGPVLSVLASHSATLHDVHIAEPSLEDVFIELTGREPR